MAWPLAFSILAIVLIPLVPNLLRLRISFFRRVHWDWAADVHEKYFVGLVSGVRIGLFLVAVVLLYFGR